MKKYLLFSCTALCFSMLCFAKGGKDDSLTTILNNRLKFMDSVNTALKYQTGTIALSNAVAKLNVPEGFHYLNEEQSNFILTKIWQNPPQTGVLGMIFPAGKGPFDDSSYAFVITYDELGYVKDEDADKINYDKMLKDMQEEELEENKTRVAEGYPAIHMVGWASKPFYDKEHKVLHWAKNLHFGDEETNTLNYEVRILGRKGVLSLNAVATMQELDAVKKNINTVLAIPSFTDGNTYKDFNSNTDKIAAWTIGGLVAGKVLLKVGFWAILGKFFLAAWKFILLGLAAVWGTIKKFFGKKSEPEINSVEPEQIPSDN